MPASNIMMNVQCTRTISILRELRPKSNCSVALVCNAHISHVNVGSRYEHFSEEREMNVPVAGAYDLRCEANILLWPLVTIKKQRSGWLTNVRTSAVCGRTGQNGCSIQ